MSVFQPPQYNSSYTQNVAMQPTTGSGQAPPSPVKGLGYVSDGNSAGSGNNGLNGYVGEKPPIKEEPQNPQSLRRHTNLASPDPALSQNAFTQSQFTSNISAAAVQSQAMRNTGSSGEGSSSAGTGDLRRDRLRQYKQSTGCGSGGGSCGFTPHPSFNNNRNSSSQKPVNSRGPRDSTLSTSSNTTFSGRQGLTSPPETTTTSTTTTTAAATTTPSTIVAYTLSDPGSMYKTFSGSTTWFRVMHLIVPEGKTAKHVHVAAMMVKTKDTIAITADEDIANTNASDGAYGLRLVDGNGSTLISRNDCDNTENFQVFTLDLSTAAGNGTGSASGLMELQAQNVTGAPILFSSAIIEF